MNKHETTRSATNRVHLNAWLAFLGALLFLSLALLLWTLPLEAAAMSDEKAVVVADPEGVPQLLEKVNPTYPVEARDAGVQGIVLLKVLVDDQGIPQQIEVIKGHPLLKDSAVTAVKQWRWQPMQIRGQAQSFYATLTVRFALDGDTSDSDESAATEEAVDEMKPVLKKRVSPKYPEEARKERISGVVVLEVLVGENGQASEITTIEGPEILAEAAAEALRQWLWEPVKVDGKPHPSLVRISVHFRLQ
jgi:TonB family protein